MIRESLMRSLMKRFNIPEGAVLPVGLRIVYYILFPRLLLRAWLGERLTGLKWDMTRAALVIDGTPISMLFLRDLSRYPARFGKDATEPFLYLAHSPDIPSNLVYIVRPMSENGDFNGRKIRIF